MVAGDETLPITAARRGDPDAWATLFRRYQLPLYTYVVELLHDEQTALDVVQETFVNAVKYLPTLRDDKRFGSWLFSISHQRCIQHWRKRRPIDELAEETVLEFAAFEEDPSDLLIRREQEEEFMKLLGQLPEIHRSALLLHFLEEFSLDEIGRITGVSTGTVKSRLHYAKKELRKFLEGER